MIRSPHSKTLRHSTIAAVATVAAALAGCSSDAGSEAVPTSTERFDQSLHDMLPADVKDSGTITFGALWETPPTIYVDAADPMNPVGIAPELADLLGEVLGTSVEWENLAWPAQLPGLQAGTVDVLFGQVSATADRERSVADLIPFQKRGYGLLVEAGNPMGLASLSDLCGVTSGVPIGSNTGEILKKVNQTECVDKGETPIDFREFNGATAAVQALRGGSIDTWFDASPSVAGIAASSPDAYGWVEVDNSGIDTEYSAIAVGKDNAALTEALTAAMKKLIDDGSYAEVYQDVEGGEQAMLTTDQIVPNPITKTPIGGNS